MYVDSSVLDVFENFFERQVIQGTIFPFFLNAMPRMSGQSSDSARV